MAEEPVNPLICVEEDLVGDPVFQPPQLFTKTIKWVKPGPKVVVAPRIRKCITIKGYSTKKLASGTPVPSSSAGSSSSEPANAHVTIPKAAARAPVSSFDDPEAPFIEEDGY